MIHDLHERLAFCVFHWTKGKLTANYMGWSKLTKNLEVFRAGIAPSRRSVLHQVLVAMKSCSAQG